MSRIRTIKPEFPQSESIGKLSRDARLLFVQLWTLVDDAGRARAASRMLASLLYPYDDDAPSLMDGWLAELERAGKIRIYDVDCSRYLEIPNWLEHQKIDRPSKSRLPEFVEPSTEVREPSRALAADLVPGPGPSTKEEDQESCRADSPTRSVVEEFDQRFWKPYPRTPVMSKKQALDAWRRLSTEDRDKAVAALEPYKAFLSSKPDHPAVHACRFLTQRRFDGFGSADTIALKLPSLLDHGTTLGPEGGKYAGRVYIRTDTPEWDAHNAQRRAQGRTSLPQDKTGGWWVESRWPPGHPNNPGTPPSSDHCTAAESI